MSIGALGNNGYGPFNGLLGLNSGNQAQNNSVITAIGGGDNGFRNLLFGKTDGTQSADGTNTVSPMPTQPQNALQSLFGSGMGAANTTGATGQNQGQNSLLMLLQSLFGGMSQNYGNMNDGTQGLNALQQLFGSSIGQQQSGPSFGFNNTSTA